MSDFRFITNFVCPHCSSKPKAPAYAEELSSGDAFQCECKRTKLIHFRRSDSLIVNYSDSLTIQIHVDANESIFQIIEPSQEQPPPGMDYAANVVCSLNSIPEFVKPTIQDTIIFLETLVTFK